MAAWLRRAPPAPGPVARQPPALSSRLLRLKKADRPCALNVRAEFRLLPLLPNERPTCREQKTRRPPHWHHPWRTNVPNSIHVNEQDDAQVRRVVKRSLFHFVASLHDSFNFDGIHSYCHSALLSSATEHLSSDFPQG